MTLSIPPIRKVYQGVADRRQMFRMFDRHAQRPNRWQGDDDGALYRGEWFEIGRAEHDHMFEILPPLWMGGDMFAPREFLTGSITSVFFELSIDGRIRHCHGYCDLADRSSPDRMRAAIVERESWPVRAMTQEDRFEDIWSATHDGCRGYAGERWPLCLQGKRTVLCTPGQLDMAVICLMKLKALTLGPRAGTAASRAREARPAATALAVSG